MGSNNMLLARRPDLASELVVEDRLLCASSGKKVLWRCRAGHEWYATPASRVRGSGCPYCSGRRRIVGVNDLATTHPLLAAELVDQSLATTIGATSGKMVMWRCEHGHEWKASPRSRVNGQTCPYCSGKLVVPGVNDLLTTDSEIANTCVDADVVRKVSRTSLRRLRWRCEYGHEWVDSVKSRVVAGNGCPVCSARVRQKSRLLADEYPDIASELIDQSLASVLSVGSNRYVDWRCPSGHIWRASVSNRVRHVQSCPYCSRRKALVGETDLATTHPEIAAQLVDKRLAHELTAHSSRRVTWQCSLGHEWDAMVSTRALLGAGCPYCSNQKVLPGFNDLATTHPSLAAELADPSDATRYVAGSAASVKWRCSHGHEWFAKIVHRTRVGSGCPVCANREVSNDNSLASLRPDLAAELVDKSLAQELSVGSRRVVEWRCTRGHVWSARVYDRCGIHKSQCPVCSAQSRSSAGEREILDVVRVLVGDDVEVIANDRHIAAPLELDVVVPSRCVAIEFNGVFWHSENAGKGRSYHRDKRRACEAAGYKLIQVWEDDWNRRRDVVVRMLAAKLCSIDRLEYVGVDVSHARRIFARKLIFGVLDAKSAREFLDENHIQGAVTATFHFALFDCETPVAVMSVRSPRTCARMRRRLDEWEIQRYATSCSVVGGFSKLLAHATHYLVESGYELSRWISFSSCDVSDGAMYVSTGFSFDRELPPDYRYVGSVTGFRRVPKESFQKSRFEHDKNLVFEEGRTERELAEINGLWRCFDSGKLRWIRDVTL